MTSEVLRVFPKASELNKILNRIECPEKDCNEVFQNTPNLTLHLLKTHRKEKSLKSSAYGNKVAEFYCPEPGCKYSFIPDIPDSKFSSRYFTQFKYLKQHYVKVHLDKTFKCDKCNKGFPTELHRSRHVSTCGNTYTCSCGVTYSSLESLQTHARRGHYNKEQSKGQNTRSRKTAVIESNSCTVINRNVINLLQSKHANKTSEFNVLLIDGMIKLENALVTTRKSENTGGSVTIGTQTDISGKRRRTISPTKSSVDKQNNLKKRTSRETQTGEKRPKTSSETQTVHQCLTTNEKRKGCCKAGASGGRKRKTSMATQTATATSKSTDINISGTSSNCSCSNNNNNNNPVSNFNNIYDNCACTSSGNRLGSNKNSYDESNITVTEDICLPQAWLNNATVDNKSLSFTDDKESLSQSNESAIIESIVSKDNNKNMPTSFLGSIDTNSNYPCENISLYNSCNNMTKDLMKQSSSCHIETQTECGDSIDAFLDDYLTNFEKGSQEVDDILDQYTQTCDDIIFPDDIDLCLTNNETQTAWPLCDDAFNISDVVNSETQTIGSISLDQYT